MDKYENIIILRNIFFKCFLVGLIFLIIATLIYMPCECYIADFYQNDLGITRELYYAMWVSFVGLIKTILIFIFLVPSIAIQIVSYNYKNKLNKENKEI